MRPTQAPVVRTEPYRYVIVTPARNEAEFLPGTIASVVSQTVIPVKWVIVSDGSTDGTAELADQWAAQHRWIDVVRMAEHRDRHFAAKVTAFNAGLQKLRGLDYDVIVALDADITFDVHYFEFLLARLAADESLGLVGTPFEENGRTYDYRFASLEHVSGACQVFRRECFEQIGGYVPMKGGGIDLVAVLSARMKGWGVRTFPERLCHHHRKQGSATRSGLALIRNDGRKDYLLGSDPLWEICRAVYRLANPPYLVGGLALLYGYMRPAITRTPKSAPTEIVQFRRRDQRTRLLTLVRRAAGVGRK